MTRQAAALYLRESVADQDGIDRHRRDCQRIAAERGWQIIAEYVDNGITASDRRKDRPAYDAMVKEYEAGRFDALLCWDLDRLTRQPRQLEDWIEAAEARGLVIVTANGEADLSTDGGRLFARIKASVARGESERKAARQRLAAAQRAENGKPPLGTRLTGYTPKGGLIPGEADAVHQMFQRFHAGASLREVTAWLNSTQVPTRHGRKWNPSSVRTVLTNPRYCGRAIYQGKANGHTGTWPAIVSEAVWDVVNDRLADPRRRTHQGTDRKHLGSGLYLCGICDKPVQAHTRTGMLTYRCPGHMTRNAAPIDGIVLALTRGRLIQPDLADLLAEPEGGAARELAAEIGRLRARLTRIQSDYDNDLIDGQRYKIATAKVQAELDTAGKAQARLAVGSGVGQTLFAPDPVAAFDAAPLGVQQAVVRFLMTVRLRPAVRGRHFDPESVSIEWKNQQ